MKNDATDRFMPDSICGCHGAKRFLLLHHTMDDCRLVFSRETVFRVFGPRPSVFEKRRGTSLKESLTGQGSEKKLVTEDSKPVGSGRFRVHSQDSSWVLGTSWSSSIPRHAQRDAPFKENGSRSFFVAFMVSATPGNFSHVTSKQAM
jgi:hypothetical protein